MLVGTDEGGVDHHVLKLRITEQLTGHALPNHNLSQPVVTLNLLLHAPMLHAPNFLDVLARCTGACNIRHRIHAFVNLLLLIVLELAPHHPTFGKIWITYTKA